MPRRSCVTLLDVASRETLAAAFWRAARGKRTRAEVLAFSEQLSAQLDALRDGILDGSAPEGRWTEFRVWDPKPRRILAPCFPDRVLHHALVGHLEPVLERALVDDTFACRAGKGTLAAVLRAQQHLRRFPWFVKVDVRAYFASIDHTTLLGLLARRFKDPGVLALVARILERTPDGPGRGLPIGALTSQHFANTYLAGFDRFLLEACGVRGLVRYMDDVVFWCDTRERAREVLLAATSYLAQERGLALKPDALVGRSEHGLPFLGFRILRGALRLSLRRKRRFTAARARSERAFLEGRTTALELQAGYASALAITAHADASGFLRAELLRRPSPVEALC